MSTPDLFAPPRDPLLIDLPAISLWQPYASLVAIKAKRFETRHWPAPKRVICKRIAIHAAKRRPTLFEMVEYPNSIAEALGDGWRSRVPYGAFLCTAKIVAVRQVARYRLASQPGWGLCDTFVFEDGGTFRDDGFGDYAEGRWCWELAEIKPFETPVDAIGRQGWFTASLPNVREGELSAVKCADDT